MGNVSSLQKLDYVYDDMLYAMDVVYAVSPHNNRRREAKETHFIKFKRDVFEYKTPLTLSRIRTHAIGIHVVPHTKATH